MDSVSQSRSASSSGGGFGKKRPEDREPTRARVEKKAPRSVSTRNDADNYIRGLKESGKLSEKGVTKDGHEYYKIMGKVEYKGSQFKKGDYVSRDELHHEWEWFRGKDNHRGPINSVTGEVGISKARSDRVLKLP